MAALGGGSGMTKILAILPVWYLSSKMDWEDEALMTNLRLFYFLENMVLILACAFLYMKITGSPDGTVIYHRKPKSNWVKTTYAILETSEVTQVASQMGMGLVMTCVMHFKFGVKQSMLMQAVMQPVAFFDAPVIKKYLFGMYGPGKAPEDRAYGERFDGEARQGGDEGDDSQAPGKLGSSGDAPDNAPTPAGLTQKGASSPSEAAAEAADEADEADEASEDEDCEMPVAESPEEALRRVIQETWDSGKSADYRPLFDGLTPENVNTATDADATSLMIVSAGAGHVAEHVQRLLTLGADVNVKDDEGWTALHWASFHGNLSGVQSLVRGCGRVGELPGLLQAVDDEGCTALDLAAKELEAAADELEALKAELDQDPDPLSSSQLSTKEAHVATKKAIVQELEATTKAVAASVAGAGGLGVAESPGGGGADEEELEEID